MSFSRSTDLLLSNVRLLHPPSLGDSEIFINTREIPISKFFPVRQRVVQRSRQASNRQRSVGLL